MKRTVTILALTAGLCATAASMTGVNLATLLRESHCADVRHSYIGIKVIQHYRPSGDEPAHETVIRVSHRAPDQTRYDFLRGGPPGGLLLQVGERHILRGRDGAFFSIPRRSPPDRLDLMLQNYRLADPRPDRIAGRRVLSISIEPRHPGNPRKIMWVDLGTKLTLRTELYDSQGRRRDVIFFQQIQYQPVISALLFALPEEVREPPPEPLVTPDFEPLLPRYVPAGYELSGTRAWRASRSVVVYLYYTDGLNTLSLFQSRAKEAVGRARGFPRDDLEAIRGQVAEINFILVGDLDRDELQRMADSLRPK